MITPGLSRRGFGREAGVALLLAAAAVTAGCANLSAVRDFAGKAESLSAYRAVPADFVGTNVRTQALYGRELTGEQLAAAQAYQRLFEARQAVLANYLRALASLADDDLASYGKGMDAAAAAAARSGVVQAQDAGVFASAATLAARLVTDAARQRLLRAVVIRCDPAVGNLTAAMAETVRVDYGESLRREQLAADSLVRDADAAGDVGLARLARFSMYQHGTAIADRRKSAEAFAAALAKIAEGHAALARHAGDFAAGQFVAEILHYGDEIEALHGQLKN